MIERALLVAAMVAGCGESHKDSGAGPENAASDKAREVTAPGAPGAVARPPEVPEVVAKVNGEDITWDQLYGEAAGALVQAESDLYQARAAALDNLIVERLVEAEAAERGLTGEALVRAEVEAKMTPPSEEEMAAFYQKNQAQMQGAPLEAVKPQIAQFLQQERAQETIRALVERLKAEAGVETFMPRFRVDVAAEDSPRKGSAEAPIQIVEFSDFQCPYCTDAAETVRKVQEKYGDQVSVVYRHFPLPMHRQAGRAAEASQCANDQEKFWAYHDKLFADQKAWTDADLSGYAKDLELDVAAFDKCLADNKHKQTVEDDMADGQQAGMGGTPGFYVNGVVLAGARPLEDFVEVIDAELASLGVSGATERPSGAGAAAGSPEGAAGATTEEPAEPADGE
jgi:protein-disulfide isomerase